MNHKKFRVPTHTKVSLADYDSNDTGSYKSRDDAEDKLVQDIQQMAKQQDILYAQNTYAVLLIFQAMDAAGKDGSIKHVLSGVNPQGCQVFTFKAPSAEDLDHDYLWRTMKSLPERGNIGVFNRSYYEEALIVRVHREMLDREQLPPEAKGKDIWEKRFEEINNFEKYLVRNGILVLKFFLNVSKEEQKKRFLERIDNPDKNWKFSLNDAKERRSWDKYMKAFEDVFSNTSTKWAPWYIVPADNKWFTHVVISDIIVKTLQSLNLRYPEVTEEHKRELQEAKEALLGEK